MYDFIYNIIKIRKKLNIKDDTENIKWIINIDETPVYLELNPDKTYNIKRAKDLIIETKGSEKKHVTIIYQLQLLAKNYHYLLFLKVNQKKQMRKGILH